MRARCLSAAGPASQSANAPRTGAVTVISNEIESTARSVKSAAGVVLVSPV